MSIDVSQIKIRVYGMVEDLNYFEQVQRTKCEYETNLWAVREQQGMTSDPETLQMLKEREHKLTQMIQQAEVMQGKVREKLLRALGKL